MVVAFASDPNNIDRLVGRSVASSSSLRIVDAYLCILSVRFCARARTARSEDCAVEASELWECCIFLTLIRNMHVFAM